MNKTKVFPVIVLVMIFIKCSPLLAAETNYDTSTLFFEHWRHYDSQGIPCQECHKTMTDRVYLLPGHKECETCHPPGKANDYHAKSGKTCNKCHPKDTTYSTPLLSKINRSKDRSFYHSDQLNNLCDVCHGAMLDDSVELGMLLTSSRARMKIRRRAHRFHNSKNCKDCHKNFSAKSLPKNHKNNNWLKNHADIAPQFQCRICHTDSFCKSCHEDVY